MSTALSILANTSGTTEEEISEVVKGMIISSKAQHGAVATGAEIAVVAGTCAKYGLNPLVKECAAFVSGGKLQLVVMIDGWYNIVNRQPEFDGVDFEDDIDDKGAVISTTCKMYLKNRSRPVCVTERMNECFDAKSSVWKRWPARMIRHKAYIQAARMAFGFSELIDNDEVNRIKGNTEQISQSQISVDYNAIEQSFAECADEESLLSAARQCRLDLERAGAWEQAKAKVAEMRFSHGDRISKMQSESEITEAEFDEFDEFETTEESTPS